MVQKNTSCVVLASNNAGKLAEISAILQSCHISVIPQADLDIHSTTETGLTFVENAIIKARHATQHSGLPALADDSGLVVDVLNGEPGIYSARYAGEPSNDIANYTKLLRELIAIPEGERTAHFYCVIVYMRDPRDPNPIICEGKWEGKILLHPQGDSGFGYDPVFYVPTHHCSAAELSSAIKNQISHRAQALPKLIQTLQTLHHN